MAMLRHRRAANRSSMFDNVPRFARGRVFDIAPYVDRLMRSKDAYAFLIITIAHSDDFMQLTGAERGVQIDFPLVTPRQRGFEDKVREVASRKGLEVVENLGSDGTRFLDMNVNGESREVAAVCSKVLREVFSVAGVADLLFEHAGLSPGATT